MSLLTFHIRLTIAALLCALVVTSGAAPATNRNDAAVLAAIVPGARSVRVTSDGYAIDTPSGTRWVTRTADGYTVPRGAGGDTIRVTRTDTGFAVGGGSNVRDVQRVGGANTDASFVLRNQAGGNVRLNKSSDGYIGTSSDRRSDVTIQRVADGGLQVHAKENRRVTPVPAPPRSEVGGQSGE